MRFLERSSRDVERRVTRAQVSQSASLATILGSGISVDYEPPASSAPSVNCAACGSIALPGTITLAARSGTHTLTRTGVAWYSPIFQWQVPSAYLPGCGVAGVGPVSIKAQWRFSCSDLGMSAQLFGALCSNFTRLPVIGYVSDPFFDPGNLVPAAFASTIVTSSANCSPLNASFPLVGAQVVAWGFVSGDTAVVYG